MLPQSGPEQSSWSSGVTGFPGALKSANGTAFWLVKTGPGLKSRAEVINPTVFDWVNPVGTGIGVTVKESTPVRADVGVKMYKSLPNRNVLGVLNASCDFCP